MAKGKGGKRGGKKMMRRKTKASKAKVNRDVLTRKFITEFNFVPQQGVTVANYLYWTQPIWNSANLIDVTQNKEFMLHALQYDRWRIHSVTLSVKPKANVLDQYNAQNDNAANLVGDGRIHTIIDRDGNGPQSIQQMTRYSSYKSYSVLKPFSRTYTVKYPGDFWLDCQKLQTQDAPFDIRNSLGLGGTITVYAENFLEDNYEAWNEPYATVIVSYNVSFQGKTQANLTVTRDPETGLPVSATLTPFTVDANKPAVTPKNVKGTWKDTITDNEITEVAELDI